MFVLCVKYIVLNKLKGVEVNIKHILILLICIGSTSVFADDYNYKDISKRYSDVELNAKEVKRAKMEGECLVGLKNLNFKNKNTEFDAVAEWTRFRSFSLLEQFPPCKVLIIIEVAYSKLK